MTGKLRVGGSSQPPKWQLRGEQLLHRSESFHEPMEQLLKFFEERDPSRDFIPGLLKIDIDDMAIAKSHRRDIQKLFNGWTSKNNIIGFLNSNSALVKVDSLEEGERIKQNLQNIDLYPKAISAVESIEKFNPYVVSLDRPETVKVVLVDFLNFELNKAVRLSFRAFCSSLGVETRETVYSPGLVVYSIKKVNQVVIDELQKFEGLESLTRMPIYSVDTDSLETEAELEIKEPLDGVEYPVVGVLDTGVKRNKFNDKWLLQKKFSSYPENLVDPTHGSCVSSIILYGDELHDQTLTGGRGCKIFDATVFPDPNKEAIFEDELVGNVREAIKSNREIKIWNLSLGSQIEASRNEFSDFGIALDSIQEHYEVIICKSAGNCLNYVKGKPKSRVSRSADSIRSIVVGSVAHSKLPTDFSEINHTSPFSRIGPGPANCIKPDLTTYGGNSGVNNGKRKDNGVKAIDPNGNLVKMVGTSFSTPRLTSLVSELDRRIGENFNPILLKALTIHSAKYPGGVNMPIADKIDQMGFGIPGSADEIVFNDPYEITLILHDSIPKGEYVEILDFPFPESLVDSDGYFYGDIKLTLVTRPILREMQGAEYCQSNLDIKFGTYEKITTRDTSKPFILNEVGLAGMKNTLLNSNYKKAFFKDYESDYARERILVDYGDKYQPVKKYNINLAEMTDANREKGLLSSRKWFLKLNGVYRDFAETLAVNDGEELSQEFTLIITIRDTNKRNNIYDEVTRLLSQRNFYHSNIQLRQDLNIDLRG